MVIHTRYFYALGCIVLIGIVILIAYISIDPVINNSIEFDEECLQMYADRFCETEGVQITSKSFHCLVEDHPRKKSMEMSVTNYFLPQELIHCTIQQLN